MGIFKKAQIGTEQPSLYYDQWAEGSDVKDLDDKPKPLYHGTLSQFNEFRPGGNPENYFGGNAIYTSTNPEDVSNNYTSFDGRDFISKRDRIIDSMRWVEDDEWKELGIDPNDYDAQEKYMDEQAMQQLGVVSPRTLKLHGKMKNPANITPANPTRYESEFYDEEDNEIEDNIFETIYQEFINTCYDYDIDPVDATSVFDNLDPGSFTALELNQAIRDSEIEPEDSEGNLVIGDFIKSLFERIGHDGIIMDAHNHFSSMDGVTPGTEHHIFFQPTQLKSWTGNSGYYDHQNPVLTASRRIFLPPR